MLEKKNQIKKFRLSQLILVLALFFILVFVLLKFSDFQKVVETIKKAKFIFVLLALSAQVFTYISVAYLINILLETHNLKIKFVKLVKGVLSMNFLNVAFPSGGLSGTSFLFYFFSKEKIKKGIGAIIVVLHYLFNNLSFYFFLFGVLIYLIAKHEVRADEFIASIAGFLVTLFLTFGIYLFFRKKKLFEKVLHWIFSRINKISRRIAKREVLKEAEVFMIISEFYHGWGEVKNKKIQISKSLLCAIFVHVFDILTVFFLFSALNYKISLAVLVIGFVLADVFSFLSLVPSGFAVFEVSLALIYSGFGVPFELAVLVVLVFRFLSLWLPIPIGFWSYRSLTEEYHNNWE